MKRVLVVINGSKQIYILKDIDGQTNRGKFGFLTIREFKSRISEINVGKYYKDNKLRTVTALDIYRSGKNKNVFLKDALTFYSTNPKHYSLFCGYPYKELPTYDESIINPFLDHVREVIANNNNTLNEYILNWISFIIQNPIGKTATVLVLTGGQ